MSGNAFPPLSWLRAFEAAARHLSFTLAAQDLNLTQSAVSQHVRSLEDYLGRELFIRRTRALQLTEAGANYLPTVREAFEVLARGTRRFTGGDQSNALILQCNMAFSVFWLAPRLHRLYAAHPWLVLNIVTALWDPETRAREAAVEVRFGRPSDMSGIATRLTTDVCRPVCHPDYMGGAPDLAKARLFDCAGIMGNWESWAGHTGRRFGEERAVNLASTYVVAIQAALNGAGMAMGHDTLTHDLVQSGRLIEPFGDTAPLPEGYFLLLPAQHEQTPATRAFTDWLIAEIAACPYAFTG